MRTSQSGSLETWRATCGLIFSVSPLDHKETNQYLSKTWFVDPIVVGTARYHGMVSTHTEHHIQESGGYVNVHRYSNRNPVAVDADGIPLLYQTGSIGLIDYSRPFTSLHPDNECQSFIVPHSAIGYLPSDSPHATVLPTNENIGRLIELEMDTIYDELARGASTISKMTIERFLGCVEVAMSPNYASESAREKARNSLKRAILIFIEERLASPALNVSLILNNFGVSRASLYRMFETEDGVRAYINQRRLYRAVAELAAKPNVRGEIHRVSERWGFSSDASFNRMVRRSFGLTPGSLFQMPIQTSPPSRRIAIMHDMLQNAAQRQLQPDSFIKA